MDVVYVIDVCSEEDLSDSEEPVTHMSSSYTAKSLTLPSSPAPSSTSYLQGAEYVMHYT